MTYVCVCVCACVRARARVCGPLHKLCKKKLSKQPLLRRCALTGCQLSVRCERRTHDVDILTRDKVDPQQDDDT